MLSATPAYIVTARPTKAAGKSQNYAGSLNVAVRDAEAMKSAGLLVVSPIKRDTGP
jgi:hypothetical protein